MEAIDNAVEMILDYHDFRRYSDDEVERVIADLRSLQERSCESCKYQADSNEGAWCIVLDIEILSPSFCCNRYKEKENQ